MTGKRLFQLSQRARGPLDLDGLDPTGELEVFLGSRPVAVRVVVFLRRNPRVLQQTTAELAAVLEDRLDGVGPALAVRAALWARRRFAGTDGDA